VVFTAALAEGSKSWAFRILALPIIAAFQNHLQILLHEGAHFKLFRRRRLNDFVTNVFCAAPFFGWVGHYRHFHLDHHKYLLNPEKDPEIEFYAEQGYFFKPLSWKQKARMLFYDFCGYHALQFFFSYNQYLYVETRNGRLPRISKNDWTALAVFIGVAATVSFYSSSLFPVLFYWILPQWPFLFLFLKLQGYGEHSERTDQIETCTNSYRLGFFARFFIYPYHSEYHRESITSILLFRGMPIPTLSQGPIQFRM
jgi:fatty acid desaturase